VLSTNTTQVRLSLTGPIGPLLQAAVALDPVDMTSRPAELEELFLGYYRSDSGKAHSHGR
jgi:beta-exotoxin I transport system ATP-binding protein